MLDLFNRGKGVYIKYLLRNHFYSKKAIGMDKQGDGSCVSKRKNRPLVTTIFKQNEYCLILTFQVQLKTYHLKL